MRNLKDFKEEAQQEIDEPFKYGWCSGDWNTNVIQAEGQLYLIEDLKDEARKWIEYIDDRDTLYSSHIAVINWIKEFFCLDDEDEAK